MGCSCNRLICVAPVNATAALYAVRTLTVWPFYCHSIVHHQEKQGCQLTLRHHCFVATSHPKKVHRDYVSPDGSTKWSNLADQVTTPCLVFNVVDLTTPFSLF
ncbi:hypothetical protein T01_9489 [Trichinella spiralis]|uniref:Uncharacterized protein n=1 Tax=Trichinella spiralis TaxID=6334 RepID=A0A0V1AVN7_TRISP|nr:hypothetical protein T01_9489 [Trichinella spiralis]